MDNTTTEAPEHYIAKSVTTTNVQITFDTWELIKMIFGAKAEVIVTLRTMNDEIFVVESDADVTIKRIKNNERKAADAHHTLLPHSLGEKLYNFVEAWGESFRTAFYGLIGLFLIYTEAISIFQYFVLSGLMTITIAIEKIAKVFNSATAKATINQDATYGKTN